MRHPRRRLRWKSDELATFLAAKTRGCQRSHRLDAAAIAALHQGGTLLGPGLDTAVNSSPSALTAATP
ncbi:MULTISPECIES: hypothetical protein [unclassified Rhodococcus (in: high G+C Gram-positive bacteria)]|uniref:hypothetical protein n=1 Tax=unclassified Rhodococcus (in: high G+C Gram-positive bacteria) TaxID=192944 RepID=UPI00163B31DB|nr:MULTISPECIES: hypothetical protein [unclassified Rhodococcus (in: high G+C Gram-positive bacteria)]MBC2637509.1 hypothetical protein [Rhodococcus sp. 3A]MBC2898399.1 hypothetical protein [Rhodococcus sp. 4CII]